MVIDLAGLLIMRRSNVISRLLPENKYDYLNCNSYNANAAEQDNFYYLLRENGFSHEEQSIDQIIKLQLFIGNCVTTAGVYFGKDRSITLFNKGVSGTPLSCGPMALIMHDALSALDYKSRIVQLYRSDFSDIDTHVVVEVFWGEEWLLFDPTFNITFEHNASISGVQKIQDMLHTKGPSSVNIRYHGDRIYPTGMNNYYMDWRPLFSNAYTDCSCDKILYRLPPLRWWLGPTKYYFGKDLLLWAKAINQIYFLFIVVLPVILFFLLSLFLSQQLILLRKK